MKMKIGETCVLECQTEKGYKFTIFDNGMGWTTWFPKSQVKELVDDEYFVPDWLWDKKVKEWVKERGKNETKK